jgi:hypothetical protein
MPVSYTELLAKIDAANVELTEAIELCSKEERMQPWLNVSLGSLQSTQASLVSLKQFLTACQKQQTKKRLPPGDENE